MKKNYINIIEVFSILLIILESIIFKYHLVLSIGTYLFIICQGIKYFNKEIKVKLIIKKIIILYLILIFWNTTYEVLLDFINGKFVTNSMLINIIKNILILNTTYQFNILKIIILLNLITLILKPTINKNKYIDVLLLFILIILSIYNNICIYELLFFCGYYFSKYDNKYIEYILYFTTIISFILFKQYFIVLMSLSIALIIKTYVNGKANKFNTIIWFLQNKSFGIYLVYGFILEIIYKFNIINFNKINISDLLGVTVLTYLISLICSIWLNYLPFVNKLVKERQ